MPAPTLTPVPVPVSVPTTTPSAQPLVSQVSTAPVLKANIGQQGVANHLRDTFVGKGDGKARQDLNDIIHCDEPYRPNGTPNPRYDPTKKTYDPVAQDNLERIVDEFGVTDPDVLNALAQARRVGEKRAVS